MTSIDRASKARRSKPLPSTSDEIPDVMLYSTPLGPMMLDTRDPQPRPVTDPELLAILDLPQPASQ